MTVDHDDVLSEHARECAECAGADLTALRARLAAGVPAVDAARLSQLAMARLAPELQARAWTVFRRRLVRTLAAALAPLPVIAAVDVLVLAWFYDLAAAWLPSAVAVYLVLSYAASLLVLIGAAYAAIPLLLARSVPPADAAPA